MNERVLKEASFSSNAVRYQGMLATVSLALSVVGIPLIPIVVGITVWYWRKQYGRMRVILTSRDLKVHRGVLVTEEKSIPLEKITDLAVVQGPLMRHYGLKAIRVETAGHSKTQGALVSIVGIEDTDGFRDLVLQQRDRIAASEDGGAGTGGGPAAGETVGSGAGTGGAAATSGAASMTGAGSTSGTASGVGALETAAVLDTLRSMDETLKRIEKALADRESLPNS